MSCFFFCFKALTYIYIDFKYVVFSESDSLTGHMGWGPLCPLKKLFCIFQVFLPLLIYLHLMWQIFPSSSFFLSNTEMIPKSNAEQMPTMVWLSKNWTATIKQWNRLKVFPTIPKGQVFIYKQNIYEIVVSWKIQQSEITSSLQLDLNPGLWAR